MSKIIITAAVVGAEVTRKDTPYLPITPDEIAEEAYRCWQAGASIVHIHARDEQGNATQDRQVYKKIIDKIKERCDIIVQVSTGGAVGMTPAERIQPVELAPEMATLSTGTVNFGEGIFINALGDIQFFAQRMQQIGVRPEFEIFDAGMINNAMQLVRGGWVTGHLHFDLVLGVPGGLPATARNLSFLVDSLPPVATWTVAGIGRFQLPMALMAVAMGGHVRVGFEDNIYYSKGILATSNAQLVERIARIAQEAGRELATPAEARQILQIVSSK